MLEADGIRTPNEFKLSDAIGRNIICDDGITRKVEQISHSYVCPGKLLINEVNEDETPGGAWVSALSLTCQMLGKPVPTREQVEAHFKVLRALRFSDDPKLATGTPEPGMIELKSGLVIRSKDLAN